MPFRYCNPSPPLEMRAVEIGRAWNDLTYDPAESSLWSETRQKRSRVVSRMESLLQDAGFALLADYEQEYMKHDRWAWAGFRHAYFRKDDALVAVLYRGEVGCHGNLSSILDYHTMEHQLREFKLYFIPEAKDVFRRMRRMPFHISRVLGVTYCYLRRGEGKLLDGYDHSTFPPRKNLTDKLLEIVRQTNP